jgi:hypothetical protein
MLVHTVIFWLKKDLDEKDRKTFFKGVENLGLIKSVEHTFIGTPAKTPDRPVVDSSYDCALTVVLKNLDDHDLYQEDPIHLNFIRECSHLWKKVQIFDAD